MKKKIRIISLILAAVMLIAAIVSSSLIWLPNALEGKNKQKGVEIDPIEGDSSALQEETVVPPIVPDDSKDKGVTTTRTDLVLDVTAGERLSVVQRLSDRTLAKKKGVTGWYFGRLE